MCNEALSFAPSRALAQGLASVKLDTVAPAPPAPVAAPTAIEPDAFLADLLRLESGGAADAALFATAVAGRRFKLVR